MNEQEPVVFSLNSNFYSEEAIRMTMDSFKDICSAEFDRDSFEIKLFPKDNIDVDELKHTFCNYCLGLMK
jgi:hypothetical protein